MCVCGGLRSTAWWLLGVNVKNFIGVLSWKTNSFVLVILCHLTRVCINDGLGFKDLPQSFTFVL